MANDVTQSGSFGVAEDDFFAKVTRFVARGVPKVPLPNWRPHRARRGPETARRRQVGRNDLKGLDTCT